MGFTFILLLAYLALPGLAVIAFRSGRKLSLIHISEPTRPY